MSKKIAFFGDSFVGGYEGWIEVFCKQHNFECVHVGKYGADQIYPFVQWQKLNDTYEGKIDVCVYSHTDAHRLFHEDLSVNINHNTLYGNKDKLDNWLNSGLVTHQYINAAKDYFKYLQHPLETKMRNLLIPIGIDKFINDNNRVFDKIVHLWSFAQNREYVYKNITWKANTTWYFDIVSGMNIILDLTNLSASEPQFQLIDGFCRRPLHFSLENSDFLCDILHTAIKYYEKGSSLDFRPYINIDSNWNDYVEALRKIKNVLENKYEKNN